MLNVLNHHDQYDGQYAALQSRLPEVLRVTLTDPLADKTVVVVPSLTLDEDELAKLSGLPHYEERMLFMLILLRQPKTHVVYVTSQPIHPAIIDYYLNLLPGVPVSHARNRLHLLSAYDSSPRSLTQKLLERPTLLERVRRCIGPNAHLTTFNVTDLELRLGVALGLPLYGCDPRLRYLGSKSGARRLFATEGIDHPPGAEDLRDEGDVADALVQLYHTCPGARQAVLKLNDGFSGEGNALYPLQEALDGADHGLRTARQIVLETLPRLARFQTADTTWERWLSKFRRMYGIVEAFVEGPGATSPSVQVRIRPGGDVELVSTHDQVLGGPGGQVYLGCRFPASVPTAPLHDIGLRVGTRLAEAGAIGRLSVDFLVFPPVHAGDAWKVQAIEINLRKGGTTHPFRTLEFLTDGQYDSATGAFKLADGESKCYVATDNLESAAYRGLQPDDLIDIMAYAGLHYNSATHTGVIFHMIGAASEFGKLGMTCIHNSHQEADALWERTVGTLAEASDTLEWMPLQRRGRD